MFLSFNPEYIFTELWINCIVYGFCFLQGLFVSIIFFLINKNIRKLWIQLIFGIVDDNIEEKKIEMNQSTQFSKESSAGNVTEVAEETFHIKPSIYEPDADNDLIESPMYVEWKKRSSIVDYVSRKSMEVYSSDYENKSGKENFIQNPIL